MQDVRGSELPGLDRARAVRVDEDHARAYDEPALVHWRLLQRRTDIRSFGGLTTTQAPRVVSDSRDRMQNESNLTQEVSTLECAHENHMRAAPQGLRYARDPPQES